MNMNILSMRILHHKEAVAKRCSAKKGVLKNFIKFTVNTCAGVSFLIKP